MEKKLGRAMISPAILFLLLFLYLPLMLGVVMAFQNYNMFDLTDVHFIGLQNFREVIFDKNISFAQIVGNTIVWLVFSLFFQLTLGFVLALSLKKKFVGRNFYCAFVFYGWALSGFAIGLTWAWLFNEQFGLVNDLLMRAHLIKAPIAFLANPKLAMMAVIIPNIWYGVPFFGIMLLAALQSVPADLYEAARLDGANAWQQLVNVTIPSIKPTIVSTVLLRTMWIINFPDIIFAMTNGGPVNSTNILATQMISKVNKEGNFGHGSAIGVIIMAALFVYAVFYLKISNRGEDK